MFSAFYELSAISKSVILSSYFLLCSFQICIIIYKLYSSSKFQKLIFDFISLVFLVAVETDWFASTRGQKNGVFTKIPLILIISFATLWIINFVYGIVLEIISGKNSFSRRTIPQAIDTLPLGIFFSDPTGRVVLANKKMNELVFLLIGSYPQLINDINGENITICDDIEVLNKDKNIYKYPNGEIWRYKTTPLKDAKLKGWNQTIAQNITDIYTSNVQLHRSNEELLIINQELQDMYDRMADTIREKETLDLKVYIHDTMGRSLLTIHDLLEDENEDNMDDRLEALHEAVSVLSTNHPILESTVDEVIKNAKRLGVKVVINGYISSEKILNQFVIFATRECVTNCIRHANGNEVYVSIDRHMGRDRITITNNGDAPNGEIKEGSGLSSLRRKVEAVKGEMIVSSFPKFRLTITI